MSDLCFLLHKVFFVVVETYLNNSISITFKLHGSSPCGVVAGVLVLSWYPPGVADDHGEPTEDLVPAVMDAAHRHSIKVTGETTGMFFFPFW